MVTNIKSKFDKSGNLINEQCAILYFLVHKPNIVQTALQAELYNPTMKGALHEKNQKIISRDQQSPLQLYCNFVIARLTWGNFYSTSRWNGDLRCGKLGGLAGDYMTVACAMMEDSQNREQCRRMVRDCYYLSKLSYNMRDQKVIQKYYVKKFVEDHISYNFLFLT